MYELHVCAFTQLYKLTKIFFKGDHYSVKFRKHIYSELFAIELDVCFKKLWDFSWLLYLSVLNLISKIYDLNLKICSKFIITLAK